ncbi:hypothetical protein ACGFOU_29245 [Streptomyces sp. NPDC048595]|uniref:hypothetical protein n=1 Tax=Streptomyces sp. NPDC048595 TaxID=3365576 RepID=UPI003717A141
MGEPAEESREVHVRNRIDGDISGTVGQFGDVHGNVYMPGVSDAQLSRIAQEIAHSYVAAEEARASRESAEAARRKRDARRTEWEAAQEAEKQRRERISSAAKTAGCLLLVPAFLAICLVSQVNALVTFVGLIAVLVVLVALGRR